MTNQIVSKNRFLSREVVYTSEREVNDILDMVKQETERIESRFLEPACGNGNFLAEIVERKLRIVESRYEKSQLDYERNSVLAVSSVYGIDIQKDNVLECRKRIFGIFEQQYIRIFKGAAKSACQKTVKYILKSNILCGDALTLHTVGETPKPIIFSEWSPVNGSMFKRRDFTFHGLFDHAAKHKPPLFSDLGENVFIPTPEKEYPLTHFLRIADDY
jgi:hypothetical protein